MPAYQDYWSVPVQVKDEWFVYDAENRLKLVGGQLIGAAGAVGVASVEIARHLGAARLRGGPSGLHLQSFGQALRHLRLPQRDAEAGEQRDQRHAGGGHRAAVAADEAAHPVAQAVRPRRDGQARRSGPRGRAGMIGCSFLATRSKR